MSISFKIKDLQSHGPSCISISRHFLHNILVLIKSNGSMKYSSVAGALRHSRHPVTQFLSSTLVIYQVVGLQPRIGSFNGLSCKVCQKESHLWRRYCSESLPPFPPPPHTSLSPGSLPSYMLSSRMGERKDQLAFLGS